MEKLGKIITYLIAVCFVLIVVIFLVAIYLMGYSTTHKDKQYLDSIIMAIESYRTANHAPPETMSQLRGCLKTIVKGSEFSECYDYGCDHEHFVGGFCRLFVVSA